MIALMEQKEVKNASEKYVFKAMKNIAIQINKTKDCTMDKAKDEREGVNKKKTSYTKW